MADTGNPEDLVSQVTVTGTEESLAKLDAYAAGGSKAFDKLNAAAAASATGVAAAGAAIDTAGKKGAAGFQALGNASTISRDLPGKIKDIENAVSNLTSKFPQLTQAVGRFSQRLALVGVAAVALGVKLATSASATAKAVDGQSDSLQKQTDAQIEANNSSLAAEIQQINFASTLRKLNQDLVTGKIAYSDYAAQLRQLQADQREQIRVSNEVAAAQARVKDENDRLTKSLKDRQAYQLLIDTMGGPLLTSMTSFGRQIQAVKRDFIDSFGPGAAGLIDTISATVSNNAQAIGKFFATASKSLDTLLKNNGPQIQRLLENIGTAASSVFIGIINAAPGLIDFFNNALVPAIGKIATAFNGLASVINFVFGTKLTGGSLVLIAILAQITGSIKLLFVLLRSGGAIFKAFISVIEAVGLALAEAFGFKSLATVTKLGAVVAKSSGPFKLFLGVLRTIIPTVTLLGEALAAALGIGLGPAIIIIGVLTAALIFMLTRVDWKAFGAAAAQAIISIIAFLGQLLQGAVNIAKGIIAGFIAVVAFFNQVGSDIGAAFDAVWAAVLAGASAAVGAIIAAWAGIVGVFSAITTAVGAFFAGLWAIIVQTATVAVTALETAWNVIAKNVTDIFSVVIAFFQGIPAILQVVWDAIKLAIVNAFTTAVDAVKAVFADLLASAKQFLQPIIDLLTKIGQLAGIVPSTGVSGGAAPQGLAGGGAVRGPGSSTADLIPAWLSNNEWVIKAQSVAKYGSAFMRAINDGTFRMPRFSAGGLVNAVPRVAYATGGEVIPPKLRPLSFSIFGEQFNGLMAPEDVGQRLTKFAVARQNKSAGRKPAWLGRGRN